MSFPELRTARLRLREIVDADASRLYELHGDPVLMRWFGSDPLRRPEDALALVRAFAAWRDLPNPGTRWGLERLDRPGLIGSCGLFSWNRQWRKCSVGYELALDQQGQGLMREALQAVLPWGFAHMDLHRVEAQVHPDNAASLALLRRLGFREEGRQREVGRWGGRQHDMLMLSLLAREWLSAGAAAGGPVEPASTGRRPGG